MFRGQVGLYLPQHLSVASTGGDLSQQGKVAGLARQGRVCEGCGGHSAALYHIWMRRQGAPLRGERTLSSGLSFSTSHSILRNSPTSPSSSLLGSDHKGPDSVSSKKEMEEEGRARVEQRTLRIQCSGLLPLTPQKQRQ